LETFYRINRAGGDGDAVAPVPSHGRSGLDMQRPTVRRTQDLRFATGCHAVMTSLATTVVLGIGAGAGTAGETATRILPNKLPARRTAFQRRAFAGGINTPPG
jgi:hypothetical protein